MKTFNMEIRFQSLFPEHVEKQADKCFEALTKMYRESHRAYHNLDHINACMRVASNYPCSMPEHQKVAEIALFFHDAVYNPHSETNERDSADLFVHYWAGPLLVTREDRDLITACILATKNHRPNPNNVGIAELESYVCDVDLSILGEEWETFVQYNRAIREEYSLIPWNQYYEGRKAVLQRLLNRNRIYATRTFHDQFEAKARANLERALAALEVARP